MIGRLSGILVHFDFIRLTVIGILWILISGSVRWASRERQLFRQNFRAKGKEFAELQKDVCLILLLILCFCVLCRQAGPSS